ncbi:hypothetical protein [Amycolatopsis sp. GA6-003]|uniref:hypothetical protein n=1 Tax=Amycolatopsis sp. GA6-003 TaxID=2652444 RepID=UPI003916D9AC
MQLDAYARLCTAFSRPVAAVLRHKEVCSPRGRKSDPNFDMTGFRAHVTAVGKAPAAPPRTEEEDMPDRELRPTNGKDACVTTVVPKNATKMVISLGWVPMTVKKVAFFGPTPGSGLNHLWATSNPQRIDAAGGSTKNRTRPST